MYVCIYNIVRYIIVQYIIQYSVYTYVVESTHVVHTMQYTHNMVQFIERILLVSCPVLKDSPGRSTGRRE